ncbi:penicillin amidase [Streptomyces sp. DvalAA-14]|uniref:GNAT family N-acetyltransferase n=1 Tax=unclassified Streptomyces TaxID=2593676 RepID=UPI00081B93A8|nr:MULTISPECIES: GNAT family N-acetyltransferase [unclassified Streptomyces]MYS21401.1 GNAT family N-acetyltransferase [Streptomyces sp. SID4948]SCD91679.1 penicillin amidase [Streptomyces sp. DvalAA-14]
MTTTVYRQHIEGFGTVTLAPVEPDRDLDLLYGWVTEERARFWGMREADRARVREIYAHLDALDTHHAYLVHRDGRPIALFQTYRPEADPIGDCYDARPGDIGIHLLLGPPDPQVTRRPGFTSDLLTVLIAFVLADPDCRRIVAEPDARNFRAVRRVVRTGFTLGPVVELPDKEAQFAFLERP